MLSKVFSRQSFNSLSHQVYNSFGKAVKRVAVTGASGNIGYALLFRIASGQLLGPNQPVSIHMIDLPQMKKAMEGVKMEIDDCAFPTVDSIKCFDNQSEGFKDVDFAFLVGSKPRGPGMERADLLKDNGKIFINTGKAINDNAKRSCKVIVVGNPCNTNCLIASHYAKDMPKENFTAMTKLDHNRGLTQLAEKFKCRTTEIDRFAIWGNHSPTMVPMLTDTLVKGKKIWDNIDKKWVDEFFHPKVGKRGAEIIAFRKLSSAASAANAALEHIRDWECGVSGWTSMGIPSDGSYGVPKGLIYSFPVRINNGKYEIVQGIKLNDYYKKKLEVTTKELLEERKFVEDMLK